MSIRVDPETGLKIFDTRAAKATGEIAGMGYSVVEDEALKTLPTQPPGAVFNAEEQAKYRENKEARRGAADRHLGNVHVVSAEDRADHSDDARHVVMCEDQQDTIQVGLEAVVAEPDEPASE